MSNSGGMATPSFTTYGTATYAEENRSHVDAADLLIAKEVSIMNKPCSNQGEVKSGDLQWNSNASYPNGVFNNSGTVSVENLFWFNGGDVLFNSGTIQANTIRMHTPR